MCADVHIRVCVSACLSNLPYVRALMPLAYQSSDIADNVNFRGPPLNLSPVNLYYKQMLAVLLPPTPHPSILLLYRRVERRVKAGGRAAAEEVGFPTV